MYIVGGRKQKYDGMMLLCGNILKDNALHKLHKQVEDKLRAFEADKQTTHNCVPVLFLTIEFNQEAADNPKSNKIINSKRSPVK